MNEWMRMILLIDRCVCVCVCEVDESDRTINKLTFTATLCSSANKEERGDNYPECNSFPTGQEEETRQKKAAIKAGVTLLS